MTMSDKVFPDNTVLCNFASVHRIDLLHDWLRGRGRWTEAVEDEARRSSTLLPGLTPLLQESWLGEPLAPETDEEDTAVLLTRRVVFGGREAEPTKHLGEAMTLVLIETREELRGSWWVTDDREAAEHADRKGITTRDTMHIMGELVSEGTLTAVDGFALMQTMRDRDRHMRMPGSPRDLQ